MATAPILSKLSLSLANDDRIGLLGANGNGKSTFAKLLGGRLAPHVRRVEAIVQAGGRVFRPASGRRPQRAGHALSRRATADARRAGSADPRRAAQLGFPGSRRDTRVAQLSGGEKARLLMGLATFDGPHLLILDEPTNHLDIDSRSALAEAINEFSGAVILISHDQYLLEACADRLWLVADGGVQTFDGDMADYRKFVLDGARKAEGEARAMARNAALEARRNAAQARKDAAPLLRKVKAAEEKMDPKFAALIGKVDLMLADPRAFERNPSEAVKLSQQRAELEKALAAAEEEWLELSGEYEALMAG